MGPIETRSSGLITARPTEATLFHRRTETRHTIWRTTGQEIWQMPQSQFYAAMTELGHLPNVPICLAASAGTMDPGCRVTAVSVWILILRHTNTLLGNKEFFAP